MSARLGRDLALVAGVRLAACAAVLATGFRAVSDDDFARVVIAQQWAHAPHLDPSGTSWLPLPFWILGEAMRLFGRSLAVARGTSILLGVLASLAVYAAARWLTEDRRAALFGACLAAVFPWSARLGVATVPELWTAALALVGIASLARGVSARGRLLGGAALCAATLARYEPWFIAAAFAAISVADALRPRDAEARNGRALLLAAAAVALAGPLLWIGWNRAAHGDALHFLARVAAYRRAVGEGGQGALAGLVGYPVAMVRDEPELVLLALVGVAATGLVGGRRALARWARPGAVALALVAGLSLAAVRDGAPTHHPERAMLVLMLLAAIVAGDALVRGLAEGHEGRGDARASWALMAGAVLAIAAGAVVRRALPPAEPPGIDREPEVAIGAAAAKVLRPGEPLLLEVNDYGYIATVAGLGRPEDAVPDRDVDPRHAVPPSSFEDAEALRARLLVTRARAFVARRGEAAEAMGAQPIAVRGAYGLYRAP